MRLADISCQPCLHGRPDCFATFPEGTDSTYTLADADEGKAIKVQVSFTDDAGNDETLTSAATDAVAAPEPPASPTGLSATASYDQVTLSWDDPGDDTITGYVILRRNRDIHAEGEFTTLVEGTEAILSYALGCNCLQFPHYLPHLQRARIP